MSRLETRCTLCRDCGERLSDHVERPSPVRGDICDGCWETRGKLVEAAKAGTIILAEFERWQKAGRGARARIANKLLQRGGAS